MPLIVAGSAYGKMCGQIVDSLMGSAANNWQYLHYGNCALIGAAAVLGGVTRMVLSLTVIMLESCGDINYGLPLLVTFITARWVGNYFNEGLYDMHIEERGIPLLEWDPPKWFRRLHVENVMSCQPKVLQPVEKAGTILDMLKSTQHSGFPVVIYRPRIGHDPEGGLGSPRSPSSRKGTQKSFSTKNTNSSDNQHFQFNASTSAYSTYAIKSDSNVIDDTMARHLTGIIKRKQLCVLLCNQYKAQTLRPLEEIMARGNTEWLQQSLRGLNSKSVAEALPWEAFETLYPRYVNVKELSLSPEERELFVDLSPYMGMPFTVNKRASLTRTFKIFRSLELRHLCVLDLDGDVAGIVTRKDLTVLHARESHRRCRRAWMTPAIRRLHSSQMKIASDSLISARRRAEVAAASALSNEYLNDDDSTHASRSRTGYNRLRRFLAVRESRTKWNSAPASQGSSGGSMDTGLPPGGRIQSRSPYRTSLLHSSYRPRYANTLESVSESSESSSSTSSGRDIIDV